MDDKLIFGNTQAEHDINLLAALERTQSGGAVLNPQKCELSETRIKFLGHLFDDTGICANPDKTAAVR